MQLFLGWKQALYKGNTCMFNEKFRFNGLQSDISLPSTKINNILHKKSCLLSREETDGYH